MSYLLSVSRVPQVMADDRLLPARLHDLYPRYNAPYLSITTCAVMILWRFEDLIVIDVTLYGAGLFLEFITLIVLRIRMPGASRPFRIPLNIAGLCLMTLIPFGVFGVALSGALMNEGKNTTPALFAIGALISAEALWQIVRWRRSSGKRE